MFYGFRGNKIMWIYIVFGEDVRVVGWWMENNFFELCSIFIIEILVEF